jgi:hypothetical protein
MEADALGAVWQRAKPLGSWEGAVNLMGNAQAADLGVPNPEVRL